MSRFTLPLAATLMAAVAPVWCQTIVPGRPAQPVLKSGYVPVTVVVNLGALQRMLPPPPANAGGGPGGGILQRIRQRRPLLNLLSNLGDAEKVLKQIEAFRGPIPIKEDVWLLMNVREIVPMGFQLQLPGNAAFQLAAHIEPILIVSKEKPQPGPLPQVSVGKKIVPPSPVAAAFSSYVFLSPKALPAVMPEDVKKGLAKFEVDFAKAKVKRKIEGKSQRLTVTLPVRKPLEASVEISFVPKVEKNTIQFGKPDCKIVPIKKGKEKPDTLTLLGLQGAAALIAGNMKTLKIDLAPHLDKVGGFPGGPAAQKLRVPIQRIEVVGMTAIANHLALELRGVIGRGGIVIVAP